MSSTKVLPLSTPPPQKRITKRRHSVQERKEFLKKLNEDKKAQQQPTMAEPPPQPPNRKQQRDFNPPPLDTVNIPEKNTQPEEKETYEKEKEEEPQKEKSPPREPEPTKDTTAMRVQRNYGNLLDRLVDAYNKCKSQGDHLELRCRKKKEFHPNQINSQQRFRNNIAKAKEIYNKEKQSGTTWHQAVRKANSKTPPTNTQTPSNKK